VHDAVACWVKVTLSTTTSPAYCSVAVPSCGTSYVEPCTTEQVVVCRSTSRVVVQETSPGSSDVVSDPGAKPGCHASPS
jgi:hypothetical protein